MSEHSQTEFFPTFGVACQSVGKGTNRTIAEEKAPHRAGLRQLQRNALPIGELA
jgi:hypothetical protein